MRPWIGMLVLCSVCTDVAAAQTATYRDVAVIVNSNSAVSDSIGVYFAQHRHIPSQNILRISVPVTEEITTAQFSDLRSQVEALLLSRGIADSVNYLVTTKGVPLKVKGADLYYSASVEGELALILGPYAGLIGGNGRVASPFYRQRTDFTHKHYRIYLVTRLDGYTFTDVQGLIDRAGDIPEHIPSHGSVVLDMDPLWNSSASFLNTRMRVAADTLRKRNVTVQLDTTTQFITGVQGVSGYAGWGSNDKHTALNGRIHFTWNPGAIAETYVSTSARSFTAPPVYGQSLIADLIAEGVTGAKGYVYEPFTNAMADVSILFDLYSAGYTLAESYFSASQFLSWMDVVVGDPKYRLMADRLPLDGEGVFDRDSVSVLPVELISFTARPASDGVTLRWSTASEMDNYGFEIQRTAVSDQGSANNGRGLTAGRDGWSAIGFVPGNGSSYDAHAYQYQDRVNTAGTYAYRLRQIDRNGAFRYSTEITVNAASAPTAFGLEQNHPNPFNPVTVISYQLSAAGMTTLTVHDMLGREVSTLVNEVQPAGAYNVPFNAAQLSSGVYLYTLRSGPSIQTRRMLLLK